MTWYAQAADLRRQSKERIRRAVANGRPHSGVYVSIIEQNVVMDAKIDRSAVNIVCTEEAPSDFAFWQTQSYEQRLRTLETIRREYHTWKYGTQPRLQRVYRIVEHP